MNNQSRENAAILSRGERIPDQSPMDEAILPTDGRAKLVLAFFLCWAMNSPLHVTQGLWLTFAPYMNWLLAVSRTTKLTKSERRSVSWSRFARMVDTYVA